MRTKILFLLTIFCLPLLISGCATQQDVESPPIVASSVQPSNTVTISGWFATVWNGEPHYSITNDQGQTTQLLLDEELAKPLGGPLALDRKRVIVSGEIVNDPQGALRVLSIRFEGGQ